MSSSVDAGVMNGVPATGVTVSTNVSLIVTGAPLTILVTVTVIVVVPNRVGAGVSVSVRVDAVSAPTTAPLFGSRIVLLDVAVIVSNAVAASPMWNVNVSGVSSVVVLSEMSSTDGSTSTAPMSAATAVSASGPSTMRAKPAPR
jgi:hypothetical protein